MTQFSDMVVMVGLDYLSLFFNLNDSTILRLSPARWLSRFLLKGRSFRKDPGVIHYRAIPDTKKNWSHFASSSFSLNEQDFSSMMSTG